MDFGATMEVTAKAVDAVGVATIVLGSAYATVLQVVRRNSFSPAFDRYRSYRQGIGRAILLGLEFLIAADIVRTVAVSPTVEGVTILALIVLVRTFLSFTLELELEGRLPWQRATIRTDGLNAARDTHRAARRPPSRRL
jgi:uncharacterized membrane protein